MYLPKFQHDREVGMSNRVHPLCKPDVYDSMSRRSSVSSSVHDIPASILTKRTHRDTTANNSKHTLRKKKVPIKNIISHDSATRS